MIRLQSPLPSTGSSTLGVRQANRVSAPVVTGVFFLELGRQSGTSPEGMSYEATRVCPYAAIDGGMVSRTMVWALVVLELLGVPPPRGAVSTLLHQNFSAMLLKGHHYCTDCRQ